MRITTILGVAGIAASSMAMAQVASRPAEQKTAPNSTANDMAPMSRATGDPMANGTDLRSAKSAPTPMPSTAQPDAPATTTKSAGDPTSASDAPKK